MNQTMKSAVEIKKRYAHTNNSKNDFKNPQYAIPKSIPH